METTLRSLKCVVHYPSDAKYSAIVPLNEKTFGRITEAKEIREKWRGENWLHVTRSLLSLFIK